MGTSLSTLGMGGTWGYAKWEMLDQHSAIVWSGKEREITHFRLSNALNYVLQAVWVWASIQRMSRQCKDARIQCWINANRGPWQLFARAPLLTRDKGLSQPATRVDTTCWQLFRPAINTAHFYFFCCRSYVELLDY